MSNWWRPSSTADEPEDRVQTRRQAAAASAEGISDDAATSEEEQLLRGRSVSRLQTPQERIRSLSRGKTPPTSPAPTKGNAFNALVDAPQPAAMAMDPALIAQITRDAVRLALEQDREERDRQSRLATEAAVAAALANQTSQVQALRRPDLPPFDKENIEIWIKRVQFAYTRAGINKPKDKFAFLEKLFHAKDDPRVNSFLWGAHTEDTWKEFLTYLKERYGRTKKQRVYSLLNGIPRDGRKPTALRDVIKDMTQNITLDDVRKEVFLKEIPANVREHLSEKIDSLNFDETAEACDKYFDQNGKLKNTPNAASVNHVSSLKPPRPQQQQQQQQQQQPSFTSPFPVDDDAETDVNAVRFRGGQRQSSNRPPGLSAFGVSAKDSVNQH